MALNKMMVGGLAAAAMLAAPVAAQAGTRASDNSVRVAPVAQTVTTEAGYTGQAVSKENELAGGSTLLAILAAAAVIAGIVIIADDDSSDGA